MDPRGPVPQPFQQLEKPGRIRRRKTRRERNKALVSSHRPLARQDPPISSRDPCVILQDPVASAAPKLVVITQGRLSREHRGLFNHEVKSLDVSSCSPARVHEPDLQSKDKENKEPGGSGPGPPNSPDLPVLGQLLEELQYQLTVPQAFPRRNLVQEARDTIIRTLQGCHGCVPDLALVLEVASNPCLAKRRVPERQRMAPSCIRAPEHAPREGRHRTQQAAKGCDFAAPHSQQHRRCTQGPPGATSRSPTAIPVLSILTIWSSLGSPNSF
ncbi:Proline-rich protein 19 [Apodemus speciosus]|uniref:Proline-rich protein 19 n=1 Tax=Apodemus speciosus TaxID=105296 RepID=A0ABQ0EXG8_APOSI